MDLSLTYSSELIGFGSIDLVGVFASYSMLCPSQLRCLSKRGTAMLQKYVNQMLNWVGGMFGLTATGSWALENK
ncbi:hypothetical protein GTA09_18390 [Rhodococcus hoagii]|nr:hypothetical protein [Prescottella equi]